MSFDLEKAIATWRRQFKYRRGFTREDADELERHVRDHVARRVKEGFGEEAAFQEAMQEVGDYEGADQEYGKVYWGKLKRRHLLASEVEQRLSMLKNYLITALRNVRRQKGSAFINVTGLSIGLACSYFILLWVADETSYDRFHEEGDQIYQVWRHFTPEGQTYTANSMSKPVAETMEAEYPEVLDAVLTRYPQEFVVTLGDQSYREAGTHVDADFFSVFTFLFIQGDPETALLGTSSAVITDRTARKLFGEEWQTRGDVLGRSLTIDHAKDFTITGVVRDVPDNSSIQFDVLLPIQEFFAREERFGDWWFMDFPIYAKLQKGVSPDAFNAKFADHFARHDEGPETQLFLQPFEDVYLNSTYRDGRLAGGRIQYVRIFSAVALFLLLIASINFMNLATARSSLRAREIGVRKAVGAHQQSLIGQFMVESLGMALVAFLFALGLVLALLPSFNDLTGKHVTIADLNGSFLLGMLGLSLIVGVVAGSYPALYLSSFNPVAVLRGTFRQRSGTVTLRKGLVVFQFALSVLLIVSTVAVYLQLDYIRTTNLGMERENLLFVTREGALAGQYESVRQELLQQPGIASVTASGNSPLAPASNTIDVEWPVVGPDNRTLFHIMNVNYDFIETMRMELAAGRDFSRAFGADSINYLVNEEAARIIGGDVLGTTLTLWGNEGQIIGVVENFRSHSLYAPIEPTIIRLSPEEADLLFVRTEPGRTPEALASLENVYGRFNPGYPFEYTFVDQAFEQTYRSEAVMGTLANVFAVVALLISCLGLFGLTSFTVEQRTKEVGVRKVLGASVPHVVVLLTSGFTKLVVAGIVLAAPVAYYVVRGWLDTFQDHISLGPGIFLLAGGIALLVAMLTVSYQAVKAAMADPVKSLRYE
jgi:putative ABC transport system permease protein